MKEQLMAAALIATGFGLVAVAQEGAPEEEELAVLPEFKSVDANEDGMIDVAETKELTEMLEEEHQIEFQFETVDENRDGLINNEEYVAYDAVLKERLGIA